MKTILLIDGHNLLFQMFYGLPNPIYNQNHEDIRGLIGFVGALRNIIKDINPNNIVVIFDAERKLDRQELYQDYKENRMELEEDNNPFMQLDNLYKILDFLKIQHFEASKYEGDDVISYYCHRYKNDKIFIVSTDKDFYQLINENISIYNYHGKNSSIIDLNCFIERYKILPKQYVLLKSLVGDNSDNIKGIKGIGNKTAAKIIKNHMSIKDIILDPSLTLRFKNILIENIDIIKLNLELIDLKKYINDIEEPEIEENSNLILNFKTNEILDRLKIK